MIKVDTVLICEVNTYKRVTMFNAEKGALKHILSNITDDGINWYYCLKTKMANIYIRDLKNVYNSSSSNFAGY